MRKKKLSFPIISICVVLIVALTLLAACSSSPTQAPVTNAAPTTSASAPTSAAAQSTQTLTIGSVWDLTGTGADIEGVMQKGEALCEDYINANGGITVNGQHYQVKIISLDTQSSDAASITAAQQLVFQDKVQFVIGQTTPDEVEAVRSITDPNKVLYIAGTDDTPDAKFPYTFSALYPYKWPKTPEYDYLVKTYPNVKTVAVFNQDEAGNMASGVEAIAQIQKHGLTLGDHLIYPFNTTDYLPLVTKLVATHPDAIDMCLNMPSSAAEIVKDARQLGFTGPIIGGSPWDPNTELQQIGAQYATDFIWDTIDPTEADAQSQIPPEMQQVMTLWNNTYHVPFVLDSLQGWDPLWVLKQAIEKAQSLDPTAVATAFENMQTVDTAYGQATIGGQQSYGINATVAENVPLTRLENGKAQFLGWFKLNIP